MKVNQFISVTEELVKLKEKKEASARLLDDLFRKTNIYFGQVKSS